MARTDHLHMPEDHMDALYSSKNPLVWLVHTKRLSAIVDALPRRDSARVLDAGVGEGHLIERMHAKYGSYKYAGVDIVDVALDAAKKRCPYASVVKGDLTKLPFKDGSFDIIVCTEVLEHIYEYRAVMNEFERVLSPGGVAIVTFPNETLWTVARFLLLRRSIKVPDHVNAFTPKRLAAASSLRVVKKRNLPFGLPFFLSLNGLLVLKKEVV